MQSLRILRFSTLKIMHGDADGNCRAAAWIRLDHESPPGKPGALAHSDQAHSLIARAEYLLLLETHAVVFDDKRDLTRTVFEKDVHLRGSGMFCNIGESFLRDAVKHRFRFNGQAILFGSSGESVGNSGRLSAGIE
jgi:hypothetical protein